jgi:hypothetical protein
VRGYDRNKDQYVLCILVDAQQFDPLRELRGIACELYGIGSDCGEAIGDRSGHSDAVAGPGMLPNGEVVTVVADIIETALTEPFDQSFCLALGRQIFRPRRPGPPIEQPEMIGDRAYEVLIGSGHQVDRPALALCCLNERQHGGIVRQAAWIELVVLGAERLELRLPASKRARKSQ